MTTLIIVRTKENYKRIVSQIKRGTDKAKTIIIVPDESFTEYEKSDVEIAVLKQLEPELIKEPKISYGIDWTQEWADQSIISGKSFKELLVYKNFTLYYFLQTLLHWNFFEIRPIFGELKPISQIIFNIELSERMIKKYEPDEIIIEDDKSCFSSVLIKVAEHKGLKKTIVKSTKQKKIMNPSIIRNYFKTRITIRRIMHFLVKKRKTAPILIIGNDRFDNKSLDKNLFWANIIRELRKQKLEFTYLEYDRFWVFKNLPSLIPRYAFRMMNKQDAESVAYLGEYYTTDVMKEIRKLEVFMKKTWSSIRENNTFRRSLNYNGINFYEFAKEHFDFVFAGMSIFIADVIASTSAIAAKHPKLVLIDNEENNYGKGMMVNLKDDGKSRILSFQYELVHPFCGHRHLKSEIAKDKKSKLWRPIGDIKLATGEEAKKILVEFCNYPANTIKVIGQPSFDELSTRAQQFDKKRLFKGLGVSEQKKKILFCAREMENDYLIKPILKAAIKEEEVIIKLHPNTGLDEQKKFKEIIESKENKNKSIIIFKNKLEELLFASDIVLTWGSSVGAEAIMLDKPLLIINRSGKSRVPYVDEGAAIGVMLDDKQVREGINKCLYGPKTRKHLFEGRQRFIAKYYYKNDGKASGRAVRIIRELLN